MDKNAQLRNALNNIEKLITKLIDTPVEGVDIKTLMRDYNVIRQELNKSLI